MNRMRVVLVLGMAAGGLVGLAYAMGERVGRRIGSGYGTPLPDDVEVVGWSQPPAPEEP